MSEPRFTPGPWFVHEEDRCFMVGALGGDAIIVMESDHWAKDVTPEDKASIRAEMDLIAAAPEMYAAMQHFVDRVERGEVRSKRTYESFKAILAKARGEA